MSTSNFGKLQVFEATAISGAGTYTSKSFTIEEFTMCGFDVEIGAGITGTLTVECRNGGSFKTFTLVSPPPAIAGSAIGFLVEILDLVFGEIRLSLAVTSGSGTINAWASSKRKA